MTGHTLKPQLTLNHGLSGNPGVIGARLPQDVEAFHAVIAGQRIHDRVVKPMAHMQATGDIWRRQHNTERLLTTVIRLKTAARLPALVNLLLVA